MWTCFGAALMEEGRMRGVCRYFVEVGAESELCI